MKVWLLILALGVGTFLLRLSFIVLLDRFDEPPWLSKALRFVPPAVLAALVSSSLLIEDNTMALYWPHPRLMAAAIAAVVGWRTQSLFWTIVSGLLALYIMTSFL